VHYKIAIDRDEKHVTLQPNFDLVAPGSVVEYRRARSPGGLPNVHLKPLNENHCHFHGHIDGEKGSRAALSTCNGLVCILYCTYIYVCTVNLLQNFLQVYCKLQYTEYIRMHTYTVMFMYI
jgi:hypothetical protein